MNSVNIEIYWGSNVGKARTFRGSWKKWYNDYTNNRRDAAFYALYLMIMLYMFRAPLAHHQEFKETMCAARCCIQLFLILSFVCHVLYLWKVSKN